MPAVSGVSAQPSSANQRGAFIRTQSTAAGRMPPNTGRAEGAQRIAVTSARLCGSISARSVRRGSARNHTSPVWPAFQNDASSSHSRLGGDGSTGCTRTVSASSGRRKVWCMASAAGGALAASAFIAATTRTAGAGSRRYSTSVGVTIATAQSDNTAATGMTALDDAAATPRMARKATTGTNGSE